MNIKEILEQHKIWIVSFGREGIKADLGSTNLSGAGLGYADLRDANLRGADLRDADLGGANLSGANLSGANLSDANLSGANLGSADLIDADLNSADLTYADLSGADLNNADLSGANLRDANLRGANLRDADLGGANLSGADLPESTFIILGEPYFISITNGDYVRAGCQYHLAENWRQFSKKDITQMDGKKALQFYPRLLDIIDFYCGKGEHPDWLKEREKNNG